MKVHPILSSSFDSNVYILLDKKTCLIDTGAGMDRDLMREVEQNLKGRKVDMVINTHAHLDHVGGNHLFSTPKVYVHRLDADGVRSGNLYGTHVFSNESILNSVDFTFKEGDKIKLGDSILNVIHTPGHTPGSVCLLEEDSGYLFSGDTLFSDGAFGRVDLQKGSMKDMVASLKRLREIEFEKLFPGHMRVVENGKRHLEMALRNAGAMHGKEDLE